MNVHNLKYIDSMRGIAIVMVLLVHSQMFMRLFHIETLPFNFEHLLRSGANGVALFFIVSAYTLFRSLDVRKEKGFKDYFIRRFFRIAPLYYLVLLTFFLLTTFFPYGRVEISLFNLLSHYVFINGFFVNYFNSLLGVEWTIFVEVWFYIFLPVFYIFKKHLIKILVALFLLSILSLGFSMFFITDQAYKLQMYFSPIRWFYMFVLGGIIYQYETNLTIQNFFKKYKSQLLILFSVLWIIFSYLQLPADYIVFSFLISLFFLLNKFNTIKIFNNMFFENIGKISFSVYLIHMPVFSYMITIYSNFYSENVDLVNNPLISYLTLFILSIVVVLLISIVTYQVIEKPFMKMGKIYIQKKNIPNV